MKQKLNALLKYLSKPQNIILLVLLIVLGYLTLIPLATIIGDTFKVHSSEVRAIKGSKTGEFTLYHWIKMFASGPTSAKVFYEPFLNTMKIAFLSCLLAILFGGSDRKSVV